MDKIAVASTYDEETTREYNLFKEVSPLMYLAEEESILHYVGDIRGKRVLDLACGLGNFSRLMKTKGATKVVGVDISSHILERAKEEERKNPLGIEYLLRDGRTMGKIGEFDIILGNFFLCYANNEDELQGMAETIQSNLASGGGFWGYTTDPSRTEWPPEFEKITGFTLKKLSDVPNGRLCQLDALPSLKSNFSIKVIHLDFKIYQGVFKRVGFRSVTYLPSKLTDETRNSFPKGFWDLFVEESPYGVIFAE